MNLGKNVYNLLKRQPEVYIKGLGAFKRNHTPATYDEKRQVYLPPISYIDFDQTSLRGADFIAYVAQLQAIDRREAEVQVADVVQTLLREIREEGQAKLDDLGFLVSYGEGYVFKALDLSGFNYEPIDAAIAPPVEVPPTVAAAETPGQAYSEGDKPALTQEDVPTEQPVSAEILEPFFENGNLGNQQAKSNAIWYILIALLALATIAALYYFNKRSSSVVEQVVVVDSPENEVDTTATALPVDTLSRPDSLALALMDSTQAEMSAATEAPLNNDVTPDQWQIVIGIHPTMAKANEHAAAMRKKGYTSVRAVPSKMVKNNKKVIWDSYVTKEEMEAALQYVRKNIEKDAWPDKIN
ncbi:HU domain-containing protein [Sphingobacterium griseoflavum]|uniref:CCDC81-like prokaryotic HU domain-containing protein n=1 Tax=Sphingobacterium griseoflavum TaxID=1474952 RepID=A0ABQ3HX95_9SPHI|nr:hypothetical protein [Sphingobacterium griseoflavum]GHE43758.1 hypothetical protein GCM10017764_28840 [Sphingobacterium griseoflavum]